LSFVMLDLPITTIDGTVATALLAILSSLVGALVWVVRSVTVRSDRVMETRDKQVGKTIEMLRVAVSSFQSFQHGGSAAHSKIIERLDALAAVQAETAAAYGKIIERLDGLAGVQAETLRQLRQGRAE
jgi:phosphate/sulfate permease